MSEVPAFDRASWKPTHELDGPQPLEVRALYRFEADAAPVIVVAATSRFDTQEFYDELKPFLDRCIEAYVAGARDWPVQP